MTYHTGDIRNIALVGHAGAGKTLLLEALLLRAGAIHSAGDIARGTTISDYDPLEKEFQHSLDASCCHLDYRGKRVHLLDTPGYPDLLGRALAVLPAVETAAVVVNAQAGVEMGTRRMMAAAARRKLCRAIIVNRIDAAGADLPALIDRLREAFGKQCLPINLPADGGTQVLDCFFSRDGPTTDFSTIAAAHREIIEQVVEVDETLLERYLEGGEDVDEQTLHVAFETALRQGHLVPICFSSAQTGVGIGALLDLFARLMPNPTEGNPPPFVRSERPVTDGPTSSRPDAREIPLQAVPDPDRHVIAHVFKINIDPYAGRIAAFRIHQGTVRPGSQLYAGDRRKPFKVAHLYALQGKQMVEKRRGIPGDICAVTKVDELTYDAVLHDSHDEDHYRLREPPGPPPLLGLAVEPARHGDEQKLAEALHKIQAEDPSLRVEQRPAHNETVLYGLGELHLRIALERLRRAFNVEVTTHPPSVPFRETITRAAEGHYRHKKQSGGAGQFGEVFLRVEPLPRGAGFEFVDAVKGGAIPAQFIPAVEKGVRQVLESGAVAGYPMQDLRVTVYDGKTHPVDGKEVAFAIAGRKAFIDAVGKAGAIVLEPFVNLSVSAPAGSIGNITGDLAALRGRISRQDALPGNQALIEAQAPLAELRDYHHRLKAQTAGEGSYSMEFSHYEPAPPKLQSELIGGFGKRRQQELD